MQNGATPVQLLSFSTVACPIKPSFAHANGIYIHNGIISINTYWELERCVRGAVRALNQSETAALCGVWRDLF